MSAKELPHDCPIRCETLICRKTYEESLGMTELQTGRFPEIGLIESGSGVHRILHQEIPCRVGDICIVSADIPHGYFCTDPEGRMRVKVLSFDPRMCLEGECADPASPRYCCGVFADNPMSVYAMLTAQKRDEIAALMRYIERELSGQGDEWRAAVGAYLSLILIGVRRYVSDAIKNSVTVPQKERIVVQSALRAVNEQFGDPALTLESIAKSLFISKSYLSGVFRRFTGESFSAHLRSVRLNHACTLLKMTDLTVEEIVFECGLRDVPSFYRTFHSYVYMTPHQYRVKYKEKYMKEVSIMSILQEISENLQRGKSKIVKELVEKALAEGCKASDILNEGLLAGMSIIGEKFKNNEVYVPEVLVAARAMNAGTQILKPYLAESGVTAAGRVCIGTVQGDLHDIGKNLVKLMMEGKGLEVIDLGTDVSAEMFVKTAAEQNCQIICCSALLTTTMGVMADVVRAAQAAGIRDKVKIMVGGAPVTQDFCEQIGADCYTPDAATAADAAAAFCKA